MPDVSGSFMRLFFLLMVVANLFASTAFSQSRNLEITLTDARTGKPIAYATVFNDRSKTGTASNLQGFFRLVDVRPDDVILISFIGYEKLKATGRELYGQSTIKLEPKVELLRTVIVEGESSFLYNLVSRCKRTASAQVQTARTYFSLETTAEGRQVEMLECYYNCRSAGYDLEQLDMKNGRIAVRGFQGRFFVNVETSKALYHHRLFANNKYFPAGPLELSKGSLKRHYLLTFNSRYTSDDGRRIYVVDFESRKKRSDFFEGTVWIDSLSNAVIKVNYEVKNAALHPFLPMFPDDTLKRIDLQMAKTFTERNGQMVVNSIDFIYGIKYKARGGTITNAETQALVYAYNYDKRFILPHFDFTDGRGVDYRRINGTPYNDYFWQTIDEFKLNDKPEKNASFLKHRASLTNKNLFRKNKFSKYGIYEHPYVFWSKDRIRFREDGVNDDYGSYSGQMPSERYKLVAQIYCDINPFADTIQVLTKAIFDPYGSFFHYPMTEINMAFLNLYFDLVEVHRRELEEAIAQAPRTVDNIERLYARQMTLLEKESADYFRSVQRGTDLKAMQRWNDYIRQQLGIDNLELFQVENAQ